MHQLIYVYSNTLRRTTYGEFFVSLMQDSFARYALYLILFFGMCAFFGTAPRLVHAQIQDPTTITSVTATFDPTSHIVTLQAEGDRGCVSPCRARTDTLDVNSAGWIEVVAPRSVYIPHDDPKMEGLPNTMQPAAPNSKNGSSYFPQNGPAVWTYIRRIDASTWSTNDYRFCMTISGNAGSFLLLPSIDFDRQCATVAVVGQAPLGTKPSLTITSVLSEDGQSNTATHPADSRVDIAGVGTGSTQVTDTSFVSCSDGSGGEEKKYYSVAMDLLAKDWTLSPGSSSGGFSFTLVDPGKDGTYDCNTNTQTPATPARYSFSFAINTTSLSDGTYQLQVNAKSGEDVSDTRSLYVKHSAIVSPDFLLVVTPSQTIKRGNTAVYTIAVDSCRGGFNGPITNISIESGLPKQVKSVVFTPVVAQIPDCSGLSNVIAQIETDADTELGSFTLVFSGNGTGVGVRRAQAELVVDSADLLNITIAPASATKLVGTAQAYTTTAHYGDGSTKDVTANTLLSSLNPAVVILGEGKVAGSSPVTATITGTYVELGKTVQATANFSAVDFNLVCPASFTVYQGAAQSFTIFLLPQNNFAADVPFSVSAEGLTPLPSSGVFTQTSGYTDMFVIPATSVGQFTLTVTGSYSGNLGTKSASCSTLFTVKPNLRSITLLPSNASILVAGTQTYSVLATYTDNTSQDVTAVSSYTSSNTAIAAMTNNVAKGVSVGSTSVSASYTQNGITKEDTASLQVTGGSGGNVPPNQPTGLNTDNSACGKIKITWTAPLSGSAPTGYRVYVSPSNSPYAWTQVGGDISALDFSVIDSNPPNKNSLNFYAVTAFNTYGESSKALAPAIAPLSCTPNFQTSDKDISAVNNKNNSFVPCNNKFDSLSTTSLIKAGSVISFAINVCNFSGTGAVPAGPHVSVVDRLSNVSNPTNFLCRKSDSSVCSVAPTISGSFPNQQISMIVDGSGLATGEWYTITFSATVPTANPNPAIIFSLKNQADIYFDGNFQKRVSTPTLLFYNGGFVPKKEEIAP